jgi:hypothetical protein
MDGKCVYQDLRGKGHLGAQMSMIAVSIGRGVLKARSKIVAVSGGHGRINALAALQ